MVKAAGLPSHALARMHNRRCIPHAQTPVHSLPADLGDSSSDTISTPSDLANSYFPYTSGVGASIHSGERAAAGLHVVHKNGGARAARCCCCCHPHSAVHTHTASADSWGATNIYYDFLARQVRADMRLRAAPVMHISLLTSLQVCPCRSACR